MSAQGMIDWLQDLPPLIQAAIGLVILLATVIAITASEAAQKRRRIAEQLRRRRIEEANRWRPRSPR